MFIQQVRYLFQLRTTKNKIQNFSARVKENNSAIKTQKTLVFPLNLKDHVMLVILSHQNIRSQKLRLSYHKIAFKNIIDYKKALIAL
jgi:hypothetical protein